METNRKAKWTAFGVVGAAALAAALAMSLPQRTAYGQRPIGFTDTPRPPMPTSTPIPPIATVTPAPGVATPVGGVPDVWVRLAGFGTCSAHDGYVDYAVGIGNDGGVAYNVEVVNAVSTNLELVQIQPTRGTVVRAAEPNVFTLQLGTLAPGETAVVTVRVRVLGGAGSALSALASVRTSTAGDDTQNNVRSLHCITGNAPPILLPTPAPLPTPGAFVPGEVTVIGMADASQMFTTILLPETGGDAADLPH